jgi:hypothetical protein
MTLIMGQMTVPAASTIPTIQIPPGSVSVNLYNTSGVPVFLGTSTAVTSTNGLVMSVTPASFQGYMTGKGAVIYAANTSATSVATFNYVIDSDQL